MQKTYDGSCHCGAFKFKVDMELQGVMTCNCSMCQRAGYMLAFVPPTQLHVEGDASAVLKEYRFNTKTIAHLFCTTCGIHPIARGKRPDGVEMAMVNVRCLQDVELEDLPVKHNNGRAR